MAEFLLDFGAKIDILTKDELDDSLSAAAEIWAQRARGVKYVRRTASPDAATLLLDGPRQGFAWDVKLLSMALSAAGNVTVYQGESARNATAYQTVAGAQPVVFTWSSHEWLIPPGEKISVIASAGVITDVFLTAVEVPAERAGVILS